MILIWLLKMLISVVIYTANIGYQIYHVFLWKAEKH